MGLNKQKHKEKKTLLRILRANLLDKLSKKENDFQGKFDVFQLKLPVTF